MRQVDPKHTHRRRSIPGWPVAAVVVAAVLLVSYGGAIVLAPITLPVLYLALSRNETGRGLRVGIVAVAALTAAEVGWAAVYLSVGEGMPWIWLAPVAAGGAALAGYSRTRPAARLDLLS